MRLNGLERIWVALPKRPIYSGSLDIMLFKLDPNSPKFEVFVRLNEELLHFLEHAIAGGNFKRSLLTSSDVGQACWNNFKAPRAKNDLTRDKFKKLFVVYIMF